MASGIQYLSLVSGVWCLVESVEVSLELPGPGGSAGQQEGDGGLAGGVWYLVSGFGCLVSSVWLSL